MVLNLAAIQKPDNRKVDNRMGETMSKLFWWHRTPLGEGRPTTPALADDFVMAPDSDELSPGCDGPRICTPRQDYGLDLLWPYNLISSYMRNASEEESDLKKRRPALYDEYWT